jgi:hypothetical protein
VKEIPLANGQKANATLRSSTSLRSTRVDDEDYEYLSRYKWYAYCDCEKGMTYAAHDTPSGRRVFMHDVVMGLDTLEDE